MAKYLKLFENHSDYQDFIDSEVIEKFEKDLRKNK